MRGRIGPMDIWDDKDGTAHAKCCVCGAMWRCKDYGSAASMAPFHPCTTDPSKQTPAESTKPDALQMDLFQN